MRRVGSSWARPRRRADAAVDVGLQAERTAMAWQRTALGVGGMAALLLHRAGHHAWATAPGVLGLVLALTLLLATERRYEQTVRRVVTGQSAARPAMVRTVAAGAVFLALSALVLVLVVPA